MATSTQHQAAGIEHTCLICIESTPQELAAAQWALVFLGSEGESE